jgi:hypothetical protein
MGRYGFDYDYSTPLRELSMGPWSLEALVLLASNEGTS